MNFPRQSRGGHLSRSAAGGFSLVEIMVVVLIISMLATLAVPTLGRLQRKTKTASIMNDFRVFGAAFDTYAQETGGWPAESAAGVMPTGMSDRLNNTAWARTTPMSGKYDWENNQMQFGIRYKAAIAINAVAGAPLPLDVNQLLDLEYTLDGKNQIDWFNGSFHLGSGLNPVYIIQP